MPLRRLTFDNPWIAALDAAPRPASSWTVLVAGGLCCAAAVVLGRDLGARLAEAISAGSGPWGAIAGQAAFYACIFAPLWLAALVGGAMEGRQVWRGGPLPLLATVGGVALGGLGFAAAVGLAAASGAVMPPAAPQAAVAGGVIAGAAIVAFQAAGEEVFFRGWIQPVLCARLGPWVGLALTAAMFTALHLVGGVRGPLAVLNLLLGGLLFGLLALRTGGLWAAFGAHWAWNWTESCGFGLDPNPGVGPTGSLVDLDLGGPGLWSGGGDGMNGSPAATLVLLALLTGLAFAPRRAGPAGVPQVGRERA
ncbi:MAG: CPBP family intramembrane glutamic endopeptidase [Phenylobacterium sp.]